MNVGLDVRVVDQIGLANPLAAHTARLQDSRIGHDKNLFPDWAVAEGPWFKQHPYLPAYLDEDWVAQAEEALKCPDTDAVLTSIRSPLTFGRFLSNLLHAHQFTSYRIDRVPRYELIRCGLSEPPSRGTPYTWLTGDGALAAVSWLAPIAVAKTAMARRCPTSIRMSTDGLGPTTDMEHLNMGDVSQMWVNARLTVRGLHHGVVDYPGQRRRRRRRCEFEKDGMDTYGSR